MSGPRNCHSRQANQRNVTVRKLSSNMEGTVEEKQEQEGVEQEPEQTEKPEQKRIRLKSLRSQIQATLNSLEAISNDPKQKKNCQSDAALKRADLLLDLSRLDHKKEVDAALAENATFHEQLDAKDARIAELETECEQLRASQHPVEIREIPDSRLPETIALNQRQADLLQNAAQEIRANCEEPTRLKIAAVLVKKMGRDAQPFVSDIVDFASIYAASTRTDDELQDVIDSAFVGSRGSAVLVARATLAARGIEYTGPSYTGGGSKFRDEFV